MSFEWIAQLDDKKDVVWYRTQERVQFMQEAAKRGLRYDYEYSRRPGWMRAKVQYPDKVRHLGKPGYFLHIQRNATYLCKTKESIGIAINSFEYDDIQRRFKLHKVETADTWLGSVEIYVLGEEVKGK